MKLFLPVLVLLTIIAASCSNQRISHSKIPSVVINTLQAKYPLADDIDWKKNHDLYEAALNINDTIEVIVRIDYTGKLLMQKQDIPVNELPAPVIAFIQSSYKDYSIEEAEKLEKDNMIYYQVELDNKRKREINIVFTANGEQEKNMYYWD